MMKILFICTANICRSPLAEVILKKKIREQGLADIEVLSAGIRNFEGRQRDTTMIAFARKAGYDLGGEAKYLTKELAESADLIICMENQQKLELYHRFKPYVHWDRIHLFNEICFENPTDLIDPTGDTDYMYDVVLKRIERGCKKIVEKLSCSSQPIR